MDRSSDPVVTWARAQSARLLFTEGALFGAVLGGFVVVVSVFQEDLGTLLLSTVYGAGFGMVYGLGFALGGWTIGWMLVRFRVVARKGLALALGVAITAVLMVVSFSVDGTFDTFLVTIPCVVAVAVGLWRGRHYDRALTN